MISSPIPADALLGASRTVTASTDVTGPDLTALIVVWGVWLALCIGLWVWNGLALSGVFATLGEARWKAWVPVVMDATVLRLGGFAAWNVVFAYLPVANMYAVYQRIVAISRINVVYGKGAGFTVLGVVCTPLWATMLGSSGPVSPSSRMRRLPTTPNDPGLGEAQLLGGRPAGAGLAEPHLAGAAAHPSPKQTLEEVKSTMTSNQDQNPPALSPYDAAGITGAPTPPPPPPAPPAFDFNAPPPPAPPAFDFNAPPPPPPPAGFDAPVAFDAPPPPPPPPVGFDAPVAFDAPPPPPPPPAGLDAPVAFDAPPPPPVGFDAPADEPAMAPIVVHNPWAPADEATAPEIDIPLAPLAPPPPLVVQPASVPVPVIPEPMTGSLTTTASQAAIAEPVVPVPARAPAVTEAAPLIVDVPGFADDDDEDDGETVVVDRRPVLRYRLVVDGAGSFPLAGQRILLGRKPVSSDAGVQALAVPDATKTLSKVHARLDLADGAWTITDLGSTNGVVLLDADGTERILEAGVTAPVAGTFVLGKLAMSIELEGPGS